MNPPQPTQTRLRPWDTLRLIIAALVSSAKVDPTKSAALADAQVLMQNVAAQLRAARVAFERDVQSAEHLGLPLTPEESMHLNTLLWRFAGVAPIPLKDPPAAPTLAAAGALPPLEPISTPVPGVSEGGLMSITGHGENADGSRGVLPLIAYTPLEPIPEASSTVPESSSGPVSESSSAPVEPPPETAPIPGTPPVVEPGVPPPAAVPDPSSSAPESSSSSAPEETVTEPAK